MTAAEFLAGHSLQPGQSFLSLDSRAPEDAEHV
jgi:hypothetical protein